MRFVSRAAALAGRKPAKESIRPAITNEIFVGGGLGDEAQSTDGEQKKDKESDEGEIIESTEEEVQPRKVQRTPVLPTQSQLDGHRIDHFPYRSWCPECVEGFGREIAHASHANRASWVPVVSCDYLFLSARGVFMRKEWTPPGRGRVPEDPRNPRQPVQSNVCTRCP